ncbi:SYP6 protein [Gonium pectorale]|uniref:SYP6 protein n=1 Tax=Gonium pectorale TaxID=33097 RepID=A0A150GHP4_GONPE|nr:SYP6 protein [Gonium pectorale]|eukprot:KXZ49371.1 SYP6 protein [Gonium pectorale]
MPSQDPFYIIRQEIQDSLNELDTAVDRASENPQRFNLTPEELSSRRRWIGNTRRQLDGMRDTLRTATAPAPTMSAAESKAVAANDTFVTSQYSQQQAMLKRQDEDLEDIEQAVIRIGRQGREISNELSEQAAMLDELDAEVDTTSSRLKAAQKKMSEIIRKSSSNTQLVLIVALIIILVLLSVFAFM